MSKNNRGGVSSYTHTRQQMNNYANQHNPNNSACIDESCFKLYKKPAIKNISKDKLDDIEEYGIKKDI